MTKCDWHTCNKTSKAKFCSPQCKNKFYVDKRRKVLKVKALEYKGAKCECCGYAKSSRALQFHHLDPNEKDFTISSGQTKSWEKIKDELDKCILLCSNCHAEHHDTTL